MSFYSAFLFSPLTFIVLAQGAINQRTLAVKRKVPTQTEVAVCWTRPVARLTGAVARLTAPPAGVAERLRRTLLAALAPWSGRAAQTAGGVITSPSLSCVYLGRITERHSGVSAAAINFLIFFFFFQKISARLFTLSTTVWISLSPLCSSSSAFSATVQAQNHDLDILKQDYVADKERKSSLLVKVPTKHHIQGRKLNVTIHRTIQMIFI